MAGRASAFAVLGLEPGADAAAIDAAYRRLIKQYHPDREGGDGVRAAEIIHAYRELRGGRALVDPLQFNENLRPRRRRRRWPWTAALALLTFGAGGYLVATEVPLQLTERFALPKPAAPKHRGRHPVNAMEEPLNLRAIDNAIAEAVDLHETKDEMALAAFSRECHRQLRERPSVELLDRCAAFDNAVVGLEDRDPLRDAGPFAPLAVTGRQWSAASVLSDDYLAIDGRLDKVRLRVELALAPREPPPEVPRHSEDTASD
ncbi:MAG TPA: J domain-containing protein [Sphingomicrobium sp.]|jgi:hypothetical protein